MNKLMLCITGLLLSCSAQSQILPIVGDDNCIKAGSLLTRCQVDGLSVPLPQKASFINKHTILSIRHEGNCSTQFPISMTLMLEGLQPLPAVNVLQPAEYAIPQGEATRLSLRIDAPYSSFAYFDSSCHIDVQVEIDHVNQLELSGTLAELKHSTLNRIMVVNDRISDKTNLASLMEATFALEQVLSIATQDTSNLYSLNEILEASCEDGMQCSWSEQIGAVVNNPAIVLPFAQKLMLFNLGLQLDLIVPGDCMDNSCLAELIDPEVQHAISEVRRSFSVESLGADLRGLVDERFELEDLLTDYQEVAARYEIDWNLL